ncbi:hypothetical protein B0O99DRAFT_595027 [Bisporella sp. PMI_857]|nr:hypothetical protein B0O99DRAFT_595027 [Bisporella sp. PMI_857]
MLSKFFNSARNLLSYTPESELITQSISSNLRDKAMVTTRGQAVASAEKESLPLEILKSTSSSQPYLGVQVVSEASERKETLPVRAKDEEHSTNHTTVKVVIPVGRVLALNAAQVEGPGSQAKEIIEIEDSQASEADGEEEVLESIEAANKPDIEEDADDEAAEESKERKINKIQNEPPQVRRATRKKETAKVFSSSKASDIQKVVEVEAQKAKVPKPIKKESKQDIVEISDDSRNSDDVARQPKAPLDVVGESSGIQEILQIEDVSQKSPPKKFLAKSGKRGSTAQYTPSKSRFQPSTSPATLAVPTPVTSKHKRFGSEDPEPAIFSAVPEPITIDEEEDSGDDDDAPEEFGKEDASKALKAQERDAAKAIKEQQAELKSKRRDREAALQKQASASNKRKRDRHTTAPSSSKKPRLSPSEDAMDLSETTSTTLKPTHVTRAEIPEFLPEEYLEEDSDNDIPIVEKELLVQRKKKFNHRDLLGEKLKDRRRGGTIYRVSQAASVKLAPKANLQAKDNLARMMKGGNRKPSSGSFFKKR